MYSPSPSPVLSLSLSLSIICRATLISSRSICKLHMSLPMLFYLRADIIALTYYSPTCITCMTWYVYYHVEQSSVHSTTPIQSAFDGPKYTLLPTTAAPSNKYSPSTLFSKLNTLNAPAPSFAAVSTTPTTPA